MLSDHVFVLYPDANSVLSFFPNRIETLQWNVGTQPSELSGMAASSDGVYVLDSANNQVFAFSPTGGSLGATSTLGDSSLGKPSAIAAWNGSYFVLFPDGNAVRRFPGLTELDTQVVLDDLLQNGPSAIAASGGNVYVLFSNSNHILPLNSAGKPTGGWSTAGIAGARPVSPSGIAATAGNVYVLDSSGNQVLRFTSSGVLVGQWNY